MLRQLIGDEARFLFRLAYGVVRDSAAAEDAVQAAFLRAWQRPPAGVANLRAWLARLVIHEALQELRRRRTERQTLERGRRPAAAAATLPDGGEPAAAVREALLTLPETTRAVVVLRIMQGLSGNEVAGWLECSPAEVSRHLYRGLEQLRACLAARRPEQSRV